MSADDAPDRDTLRQMVVEDELTIDEIVEHSDLSREQIEQEDVQKEIAIDRICTHLCATGYGRECAHALQGHVDETDVWEDLDAHVQAAACVAGVGDWMEETVELYDVAEAASETLQDTSQDEIVEALAMAIEHPRDFPIALPDR